MTDINHKISAIILAAGKGSRMKSTQAKVMHKVGGQHLLDFVIKAARDVSPNMKTTVVLSSGMADTKGYCEEKYSDIDIAIQLEQSGTATAVQAAQESFQDKQTDILIMLGDVPGIKSATMKKMLMRLHQASETALVVLAMRCDQPNTYGRLVTDMNGNLIRIVETRDATEDQKKITLCNAGFYAVKGQYLAHLLQYIQPSPVTGEYYLTDIVEIACSQGLKICYEEGIASEVFGINTQKDLAQAEFFFQEEARQNAMAAGVTLVDPSSIYFSYDTTIAANVTVYPQVFFGPNVQIESGAEIFSFSHLEGVHVLSNAKIGPFARIRPLSTIHQNARVGNFVEIKNSHIGAKSKVSHLAYIGDSHVGNYCNIGAGTITVNYDGKNKWMTNIKDHAFIGSNSTLVAPVEIEEGAFVAAGSTITQNVAENALAYGRARQVHIENGAKRFRDKIQLKKK